VRTDEELSSTAMRKLITYHHQVGTCKMGSDNMAVVSPAGPSRFYGVEGHARWPTHRSCRRLLRQHKPPQLMIGDAAQINPGIG